MARKGRKQKDISRTTLALLLVAVVVVSAVGTWVVLQSAPQQEAVSGVVTFTVNSAPVETPGVSGAFTFNVIQPKGG